MLYPQNGDRIVAVDTVMSLHPMYTHRGRVVKRPVLLVNGGD